MLCSKLKCMSSYTTMFCVTFKSKGADVMKSCNLQRLCFSSYNHPPSGSQLPRPAGIATMFRLPYQSTTKDLDACFVGVPVDSGTCNRPGTRFGPRQIRTESVFVRPYNYGTGAAPYSSLQVADVGDVWMNQYNLPEAAANIKHRFKELISNGCKTIAIGGDHTITYPILQAFKEKYGPLGLIHVDAHDDFEEEMCGSRIAHGTWLKRAGDEGCIDFDRVVQIGLRGTGYSPEDWKYGIQKGFHMVPAEDCWYKSLTPLMSEVRQQMGDGPVYLSFDIDSLDPSCAPGTGTPEIGGLTTIQGMEIIRGCKGLNVVGADLVEVSPPYDTTGNTSLVAANLLFEILCILPEVKYIEKPKEKKY